MKNHSQAIEDTSTRKSTQLITHQEVYRPTDLSCKKTGSRPQVFLLEPYDQWPKHPLEIADTELVDNDPDAKRVTVRTVIAGQQDSENSTECVSKLIQHYSSWNLLKRTVACILKVRKELFRRVNMKRLNSSPISQEPYDKSKLSHQDLKEAEKSVLKFNQQQEFDTECNAVASGNSHVNRRRSRIRNLDPFLNDGILRVGGRLHQSSIPAEMKYPVILPKDHHVSTIILRQIYQELIHSGRI